MISHFEEKNENKYLVLDDGMKTRKFKEIWESLEKC